ncbi:MAG: DegT/DnrJ/EryC1/StrS family aminotransferase, partial [Candidatus Eremiobacterota bacterium]
QQQGVSSVVYYPVCLHLQQVFRHLGVRPGDLPESEKAQTEALSLPMFPELSADQIQQVSRAIHDFFGAGVGAR